MGELELLIEPDPEEAEAASVYVEGRINGKPYRFLLDTGAGRSSVIADDYTATLPAVGKNTSSGVFTSVQDDLITLSQLEVGPITKRDFTVTRSVPGPGTQNLIGMDVMRDFCCHFAFDALRVSIDKECPRETMPPAEPLRVDAKYHPYIAVAFGNVQASAVWDSGASLTVVDSHFAGSYPDFFTPAGESMGMDATGAQVATAMFMMSSAQIGGYLFPPHRVAAVDLSQVNATLEMPMNLIIGYSTFSRANWLFDFPNKQWMISRWLEEEL